MGHLYHFYFKGDVQSDDGAESETEIDGPVGGDVVVYDGERDCQQHTDSADAVAYFADSDLTHHGNAYQNAESQEYRQAEIKPFAVFVARHHDHEDYYGNRADCGQEVIKSLFGGSFFGDHAEHFVRYDKTAYDVDHSKGNGDDAESGGKHDVFFKQNRASGKGTEYRYARQSVHTGHEGRVEQWRHFVDEKISDKGRDDENAQQYQLIIDRF